MSSAPRHSLKRSVSLGFAALAVCLGCSSSSGSGGPTAEGAGAPSEDSGAGQGGASQAGANGESGGRASGCDIGECFVANSCLDQCGGKVVYVGCCECVPPAVNQRSCASDN